MEGFLNACAEQGRGQSWETITTLPAGEARCGDLFASTLIAWRELALQDPDAYPHRVDEMVGATMPALISTSVLVGDAAAQFRAAKADYFAAQEHTMTVDFADVMFGYWGSYADLERVESNTLGYDDAKLASLREAGVTSGQPQNWVSPEAREILVQPIHTFEAAGSILGVDDRFREVIAESASKLAKTES